MAQNVKIKQIEDGEKAIVKLVREEADMRREFEADGIDAQEKKELQKVATKIRKLKEVVAALRAEIERNRRIWEGRGSDVEAAQGKLGELLGWPMDEAADLSAAYREIDEAVRDQRWADATALLDTLLANMGPVWDAYVLQRDARAEFDPLFPQVDQRQQVLGTRFPMTADLEDQMQVFAQELQGVQALASERNFVDALASLNGLAPNLDVIETALDDLASQKDEFDAAWGALQRPLNETMICEFPDLLPMQEELQALRGQIEAAAGPHDYATALPLVAELRGKIDTYMAAYAAAVDQRTLYEGRLPRIRAELAEASVSEFPALADLQNRILTTSEAMEAAAGQGDYETALLEMDNLVPLLDEFHIAYQNALLGQAFERRYAELEPDFADCAQSTFGPLDALAAEIAADQERAATEGAAGNYQSALDILDAAVPKIEEWRITFAELDAARTEYERRLPALIARFDAIASSAYPQLADQARAMVDLRATMETAATEGDYISAVVQLQMLSAMVDVATAMRNVLDQKRAEYETNLPRVIQRFDGLMQSDFAELEDERAALTATRTEMEVAASGNDFLLAVDLLGQLERLLDDLDAQLGNLIDLRNQYQMLYSSIRKDLAKVEACNHVELTSKKTVITGLETEMLDAATATDFETALAKAKELVPLLTEFMKLEELLKQYLSSLEVVKPKMDELRAITYKSMVEDKKKIEEVFTKMSEDAAAARIEDALKKMDELQKLLSEAMKKFEELKKNEPVWDKLHEDLKPQIEIVKDNSVEDAEDEAEAVLKAYERAKTLGDDEDEFIKAIAEVDKINKDLLPKYRQKVDAFGDAEEAFIILSKMATEAYEAAEEKKEEYGDLLEDAFEDLEKLKSKMDAFGDKKKYEEGKATANELIEAVRGFDVKWKEAANREASLTAALDAQEARFDRLPEDAEDKAEDDYKDAKKLLEKARDAIKDKEFDDAEEHIEELTGKLDEIEDACKTAGEHQAEYEGRRDSLLPLVRQANASPMASFLGKELDEVNEAFGKMTTKGDDHGDYEAAVRLAEDVDTALAKFETAELKASGEKARYDERMEGMGRALAEAEGHGSHVDDGVRDMVRALPGLKEAAEAAAAKGDFGKALERSGELKAKVEAILDRVEELEDEEAARREAERKDGPAGELGDKVDDLIDKGEDLLDKAKEKAKDILIDKALDYAGDKAKGIYHTIDSGLDAVGSALDAGDHLLDGEFSEAWDDAKDAASSAVDSAAEAVQLHPVADGIKKGVEVAKDIKDVAEELLGDD